MRGKKLIQKKKRYKRLKHLCWIIFFVFLSILLLTFAYMYLNSQGPQVGEYLVTRTTPHRVVFTGSQVPVNLILTPSILTTLPPEGGRPLDIIIGLDNSLSMTLSGTDKTPLELVKEIALDFLENTNMKHHQVGIARLDDQARVVQGFSQNLDVLKSVINEIPKGVGTKIHDGLSGMNHEFNSMRRRAGSLGVAIILSDGRGNVNRTREQAEQLKQQEGIFIAPIGLGDYVDDGLMSTIASWPSEYNKVTGEKDPGEIVEKLTKIYLNWIRILEQLVAVDVQVREYYCQTGLELVNTSITPQGLLDQEQDKKFIQWNIPYLTTQPVTLQYNHSARDILWHQLDPIIGTVTLKPVGVDKKELPIHRKPKVIVISPLLLLMLLLLLLLPLLPLLIAWLRKIWAARGPALIPKEIPQPGLFPAPEPLPGLQLDKLVRSTDPTLVIGLGGTGRWVLTYLKKAIMETNYGRIPKTIKFLLIDTYEREIRGDTAKIIQAGGVELEGDETLILDEGTTSPEKLLERTKQVSETPGVEPHLNNWWPARAFKELTSEAFKISSGTQKRRPIGRMALFLDLEKGPQESRFWTRVSSLIKGLNEPGKGANVFITCALSGGMGSGVFTDVAYLVRHIARHEKVEGVAVHGLLALHNTFGVSADSLELTIPNTFAALRELDRFLSCRDFHFPMVYSPEKDNKINGALRAPLLDNCYVFDGERSPCSLHKDPPEFGVFPSMADAIHTFLYNSPGGAFDQEIRQRKAVSELEREESGHGVACSLGTFLYLLPIFEFIQVFKYRFAKEVTVDLFGLVKDEKGEWTCPPLKTEEINLLNKELESFLYKPGPERSPADVLQTVAVKDMEMLPLIVEADRAAKDKHSYIKQHKINYSRYLARYLMNVLNGNQEIVALERKKSYSAGLYLARQLESREIDTSILVREYLYNDAMERKLYEDYLGEKVREEHLPRFVWHCQEEGTQVDIQLKLAVDELKTIQPSAGTLPNAEIVILLPEILLQALWNMDITPYLKAAHPDEQEVASNIYEKSTPLIMFEKHQAVRHTFRMFLSLKGSEYREELIKHLRPHFPSRDHVKDTDFRDAHVFSSVSVLDSLPLPAIRPYEQALKKYLSLPANHRQQLHVFAAEQNTAVYEEMLPRVKESKHAFHPRFISHLEHLDRVKSFANCALYGLLPNLFQYEVDRYYLEVTDNSRQTRYFLTQKDDTRKSTPLDALKAFIKEKAKTETNKDIPIPFELINDIIKNNPPGKEFLLEKEKEITTMKGDKELSEEVRNLLSFIHLVLNEELKRHTKDE